MRDFPIIAKLGRAEKAAENRRIVVDKLAKLGHETTVDALRMAAARGTIPGETAQFLMKLADKERLAYTAGDFDTEEATAPKRRRQSAA